jgi:DNA invertase Pin-like site-specific DNA recombinase
VLAGLYARVSTKKQEPETQLAPLREYALKRGLILSKEHEYVDLGYSGATSRRPALDRLICAAKGRKIDAVLVWRFDRFARSTRHLVNSLELFRSLGVAFISTSEMLDTSSPMGEAMFAIIAALAQLERDIIRERVNAGLDRAAGVRLGRPPKAVEVERVLLAYKATQSLRDAARMLGLSRTLVHRVVKANRVTRPPHWAEESVKDARSQVQERPGGST